VDQFEGGKVMAVVGFEVDQVMRTPEGDVSVPITAAYNHHYDGMLNNGRKSTLVRLEEGDPRSALLEAERGHKAGMNPYVAPPPPPLLPPPPPRSCFGSRYEELLPTDLLGGYRFNRSC
jgi:hypothetical protein